MLRELKLSGGLAEIVGRESLTLYVQTPAEAVRALISQYPRARAVIENADWIVRVDDRDCDIRAVVATMPFATMELCPAIAGAEGKAGPIKIILGVFLVFAAFAGAALFAAPLSGIAGVSPLSGLSAQFLGVSLGSIAKLGAVVALAGIVRTLSPSPNANFDDLEDSPPSYTFPVLGQATQQGGRVPIVYGRVPAGSTVISQLESVDLAYTTDQTESFRRYAYSTGRYEVTDLLSEGPIDSIDGGMAGIFLNTAPIQNSAGGFNFPNAAVSFEPGNAPFVDEPIVGSFVGVRYGIGQEVALSDEPPITQLEGAVEWTVNDPDVWETRCILSVPSLFTTQPNGDVYGMILTAFMEIKPAGGSWQQALGSGMPYNFWGSWQAEGVPQYNSFIPRIGLKGAFYVVCDLDSPGPYPEFDDSVKGTVRAVNRITGTVSTWDAWAVFSEAATNTAKLPPAFAGMNVRIAMVLVDLNFLNKDPTTVELERLWDITLESDASTRWSGGTFAHVTDDDAFVPTTRRGLQWMSNNTLMVGTSPPYTYSLKAFEFEIRSGELSRYGAAPYEIRIQRTDKTDPPTDSRSQQNRYSVKIRTDVYVGNLDMPWSAVSQLSIPASASTGSVPNRAFILKGRKLRIPNGYDPVLGTYPPTWDGTWAADEEWTDNPAWVLLDYLTSKRYGMGLDVDTDIDKWSLYQASKRCDEIVPAWGGGTERRYQFANVFQAKTDALKAGVTIAAAMDCALFWADGKVFFSQNRPGDPVRLFGPSNVVGGQFSYTGPSIQAMKTTALIGWVDADDPFDAKIAIVERPWMAARFGKRDIDLKAVGAVTEGQALRTGRFELISGERESELVEFSLPMAEMNLAPGDVVAIQDPHRAQTRLTGRIVDVTAGGQVVTLDSDVEGVVNVGDTLHVAYPDMTIVEVTITGVGADVVLVDPVLDIAAATPGSVWMAASAPLETWRVISLEAGTEGRFDCQAHRIDPDLWPEVDDLEDQGAPSAITLPAPPATPVLAGAFTTANYPTRLDTISKPVLVIKMTSTGYWTEVHIDPSDALYMDRAVYEFGEVAGSFETTPAYLDTGETINGTLVAWDSAHTASSVSIPFAASNWPYAPPGQPVWTSEIKGLDQGVVEINLQWADLPGAEWFIIIATHEGGTVEDARWETVNYQARFVWDHAELAATDYMLTVYSANEHSRQHLDSLFSP